MTCSYTCRLQPIVLIAYPVHSSKYCPRPPLDYIRIDEEVIKSSKQARNLGVGFHQCLDFKEHVKITCKSAFFRIRSIAKIRRYLSQSIQKFGFINGVDNVNWPPYRDSKS